jgi:hypothetical protein
MPRSRNAAYMTAGLLIAAAMVIYMIRLLEHQVALPKPFARPSKAAAEPVVVAPAPPLAPASAASQPHPSTPDSPTRAILQLGDVGAALMDLLGGQAMSAVVQANDFPHRFAATIDNLGRSAAPPSHWPINPVNDRFMVLERDGRTFIHPDNDFRYTALVLLAEQVNVKDAVDLYLRMLPLLQAAYEDIGFPRQTFHARLMSVLDQLLAAPEVSRPLEVQLTEVQGPVPSTRPWVRYEFADPLLEQASVGQKILIRVGPVNHRRLKAVLANFRRELASR